jgi:hypothetical protein
VSRTNETVGDRSEARIANAMSAVGIVYHDLRSRSEEVVLFGSRAAGVETASSDWDVLCVGSSVSHMTSGLDLVCLRRSDLDSLRWLGSELAGHVARYGVWLKGAPAWRDSVFVSDRSVDRKASLVRTRIAELKRHWSHFSQCYRLKYLTRIRRDLQRLDILLDRRTVPPTRLLDQAWSETSDHFAELSRIVGRSDILPKSLPEQFVVACSATHAELACLASGSSHVL